MKHPFEKAADAYAANVYGNDRGASGRLCAEADFVAGAAHGVTCEQVKALKGIAMSLGEYLKAIDLDVYHLSRSAPLRPYEQVLLYRTQKALANYDQLLKDLGAAK